MRKGERQMEERKRQMREGGKDNGKRHMGETNESKRESEGDR